MDGWSLLLYVCIYVCRDGVGLINKRLGFGWTSTGFCVWMDGWMGGVLDWVI